MVDGVKRRPYDNSRRQAQLRRTRQEVVVAAQDLFLERGYVATTVEAIASAAGVAPATVYRLFGSKRGVLTSVLDIAFGGDDEPIAFHRRPPVRAALAAPDPRRLLVGFARICRELLERSAPIQRVLRGAAAADRDAAELLALTRSQRLEGQSRIARELASRKALLNDLNEAAATDTIYALMAPEVHDLLVVERGWDPDRYESWLANALCALLLAPAPSDQGD